MSDKAPNYTEQQVAQLHAYYDPSASQIERNAQIEALADMVNHNTRSVRAKLTREGIYVPNTKAPAGKASVRKAQIVQSIADMLEVDVDVIGSLEKATKNTLNRIADALR